MLEITKYFRNAVAASSQGVIEYKKNGYCTISFEELETGMFSEGSNDFFWKKKDGDDFKTGAESNSCVKNIIIALKTISTEFTDVARTEDNREEMTSVLFLPGKLNLDGKLTFPDEGKTPWIPREYLTPMEDPTIAIGKVKKYDQYLEDTTDERNKIDSWGKHIDYAVKMYEFVTETKFEEDFVWGDDEKIKVDGKFYAFLDITVASTGHILQLYNHLQKNEENGLYSKLTNGEIEQTKPLIKNTNYSKMKRHVGQMGGEYSLSPSQREAINHFDTIGNGEILAVSGPPGTGKTTLLQSIVANMYVSAALKKDPAPIIVAASTNNQAVTNIIDSFGKIDGIGIANLEKKWITGTNSFATYFPSKGKEKEAKSNNYQYTTVIGEAFVETLESDENRTRAKETFLEEFQQYFGEGGNSLLECKDILCYQLASLDAHRVRCIDLIEKVKSILGSSSYESYVNRLNEAISAKKFNFDHLIEKIEKAKIESKGYLERCFAWRASYNSLPWFVRLLKFLPTYKNRIMSWSFSFIEGEELEFLSRDMKIDEIEKKYYEKIKENDTEIVQITKDKNSAIIEIEALELKKHTIEEKLAELKVSFHMFGDYQIFPRKLDEDSLWNMLEVGKLNDFLDRIRYAEFWFAVHYYEARWLSEKNPISDKQKKTTFKRVLDQRYHRLAMISPCMVMTFFMLPKQFLAYDGNEKNHKYMYDYIDLLIVDEGGQISPEIAAPSFALAKKAIVVGDEEQIPPVWGTVKALDIAMARSNNVIVNAADYCRLEENGLNCSQSSIMKLASLSCKYKKYKAGLFLSEHRRCYDEIISYCNELVYDGKLEEKRGRADADKNNPLAGFLPAMGHKQINTGSSQKLGGSRQNREEAQQIAIWLRNNYLRIVKCYEKEGTNNIDERQLVGVITPFKSQSILIRRILKEVVPDYAQHIDVGTVHTFQGAERRVIIFSSVYGNEDGCYFMNRMPNLMNVAVSRAKDSFLVFGDSGCLVGSEKSAAVLLKKMTGTVVDF